MIISREIGVDSFIVTQSTSKRGRPLKFGRPAQLVTLTLPEDVIEWLSAINQDLGWALVRLHQRSVKTDKTMARPLVDLVQLPGRRALILVRPDPFLRIKGVSIIPLADGRGFLALDHARGVADLELAVIDRLEMRIGKVEREALDFMRGRLRQWRQEGIHFESRSIIVAFRDPASERARPLSALQPDADG